jgi:hypothetical protein
VTVLWIDTLFSLMTALWTDTALLFYDCTLNNRYSSLLCTMDVHWTITCLLPRLWLWKFSLSGICILSPLCNLMPPTPLAHVKLWMHFHSSSHYCIWFLWRRDRKLSG